MIEFVNDEAVFAVTSRLMSELKWSGVAHIDLRYDRRDGKVKVLEINARYWSSILGSLAAGMNFPLLSCQSAMGILVASRGYQPLRYLSGKAAVTQPLRSFVTGTATGADATYLSYVMSDLFPDVLRGIGALNLATRVAGRE